MTSAIVVDLDSLPCLCLALICSLEFTQPLLLCSLCIKADQALQADVFYGRSLLSLQTNDRVLRVSGRFANK